MLLSCTGDRPGASVPLVSRGTFALAEAFEPIGVIHGDPAYEFDRPGSVILAGDRLLAVANAYSEIRFYDFDGTLQHTAGRRGEGPREFGQLAQLLPTHERDGAVHAYDTRWNSVVRVTADGAWGDRVVLDRGPNPNVAMRLMGHPLWLAVVEGGGVPRSSGPGLAAVRETSNVAVYDNAAKVIWNMSVPTTSWLVWSDGSWNGQPFGPRSSLAAIGDTLVHTPGDSPVLVLYRGGRVLDTVVVHLPERPVTSKAITAYEQDMTESAARLFGSNRPWRITPEQRQVLPAVMPYYDAMLSAGRCVWARRYATPGSGYATADLIRPHDGVVISFELPVTVTITDVFDGIAVGRSTDDLGVPRIVGFHLPEIAAGCWQQA